MVAMIGAALRRLGRKVSPTEWCCSPSVALSGRCAPRKCSWTDGANQFLSQFKDARILQAIFGNVGTLVVFRVGQADAELLGRELAPAVNRMDLVKLRNWQAYVAMLIGGQARPFSMHTLVAGHRSRGRAWRRR
jgi:hypothetical protein